MKTWRVLSLDALRDALQRRIVPVLVAICVLSLLAIDSCTSCAPDEADCTETEEAKAALRMGKKVSKAKGKQAQPMTKGKKETQDKKGKKNTCKA